MIDYVLSYVHYVTDVVQFSFTTIGTVENIDFHIASSKIWDTPLLASILKNKRCSPIDQTCLGFTSFMKTYPEDKYPHET